MRKEGAEEGAPASGQGTGGASDAPPLQPVAGPPVCPENNPKPEAPLLTSAPPPGAAAPPPAEPAALQPAELPAGGCVRLGQTGLVGGPAPGGSPPLPLFCNAARSSGPAPVSAPATTLAQGAANSSQSVATLAPGWAGDAHGRGQHAPRCRGGQAYGAVLPSAAYAPPPSLGVGLGTQGGLASGADQAAWAGAPLPWVPGFSGVGFSGVGLPGGPAGLGALAPWPLSMALPLAPPPCMATDASAMLAIMQAQQMQAQQLQAQHPEGVGFDPAGHLRLQAMQLRQMRAPAHARAAGGWAALQGPAAQTLGSYEGAGAACMAEADGALGFPAHPAPAGSGQLVFRAAPARRAAGGSPSTAWAAGAECLPEQGLGLGFAKDGAAPPPALQLPALAEPSLVSPGNGSGSAEADMWNHSLLASPCKAPPGWMPAEAVQAPAR